MCATMVLPLVFMAIVAMILVAKSVVVVPPGQVYVVGTLGKANRVLQPGLHILPPFVTSITGKVPVNEQTMDVAETGGRMKTGQTAAVGGTVRYTVTEPLLAINDVDDYQRATAQLTATQWRAAIEASPRLTRAFELIEAGHFSPDDPDRFRPLACPLRRSPACRPDRR